MESSKSFTKISLHSLKNILGSKAQLSLFSDQAEEYTAKYGIEVFNPIKQLGIELTDSQMRIMEAILKGFSDTDYKGNLLPQSLHDFSTEKFSGNLPDGYKNLKEIPRLRITQGEILDWAGINKNSIACKTRALEAIQELGTTQFCFYYDRLVYDSTGNPVRDSEGRWKKETVTTVDTLFTIKKIYKEETGSLSYYEITPSLIFLDQVEGYFILIPYHWREEVRKVFGSKKTSAYTFRFLHFLRYQYELKRRAYKSDRATKADYTLKWSPEEIALALRMPDSICNRKKKRMNDLLEDAYSVAKQLGYLKDYERNGFVDKLIFNEQKYTYASSSNSFLGQLADTSNKELAQEHELLNFFEESRKKLDQQFAIEEKEKQSFLKAFRELLTERNLEDIKTLIKWSLSQTYWCTRLSTPLRLKKYFSESWIEYLNSIKQNKEDLAIMNKKSALKDLQKLEKYCENIPNHPKIALLSSGIEFISQTGSHCTVIDYKDKDFCEKLISTLQSYRLIDLYNSFKSEN